MGSDYDGKVIRPPQERISSGRVFKPSSKFLYKQWTQILLAGLVLLILANLAMLGIAYLVVVISDDFPIEVYWQIINDLWPLVNMIAVMVLTIILLPIAAAYPFYIRSFEYSVISEKGGAMPEVYTKKGLVTITRRHVPLRTITNVTTKAGPFDRLFGIGVCEIETAGTGRTNAAGQPMPDEKIEGIPFYEEVRDFILQELRKFRAPYVTGTEVVRQEEALVVDRPDSLDDNILRTLREIRDILRDRE
ncbi:MAG: PH domain-containing protein [Candidatus Thorarchaeota archaeon]